MKRSLLPFFCLILLSAAGALAVQPLGPEFPLDTTLAYNQARNDQRFPAITFDGSNYFAVWQEFRRETEYDIFGTRIASDGTVLDPGGIIISMAPEFQSYPTVAFGGVNHFVVWVDGRRITSGAGLSLYGSRVTPAGAVLDPNGIFIAPTKSNPWFPAIAHGGSNYLVVWQDTDPFTKDTDIYGVYVGSTGMPINPIPFTIPSAVGRQRSPAIAFDGTNYLVVWEDERSGVDFDIYGARVSPSGIILDPNGIPISVESEDQLNPAISFDGTNYLVVWHSDSDTLFDYEDFDIHGRRVSPDGSLVDTTDIIIGEDSSIIYTEQILPSISYDGTHYLVSWMNRRGNLPDPYDFDLNGARVDPNGTVLDTTGIPISFLSGTEYLPASASNGSEHIVVWRGWGPNDTSYIFTHYNIMGTRVDAGGSLLDSLPFSISISNRHQEIPDVASDGNNTLVTWSEGFYIWDGRIPGIRIDPMGSLIDPVPFTIFSGYNYDFNNYKERYFPCISLGDANYLVVSGMEGSHVDTSGVVLDSFPVPAERSWERENCSIAYDGTNHLITWSPGSTVKNLLMDPTGIVLDSIWITPLPPWRYFSHPTVSFDGVTYLAVWVARDSTGETGLLAGRITTLGIPIDTNGIFISQWITSDLWGRDPDRPHSIAFDGTQYFVVWEDIRNDVSGDNSDLYGARITPDGTVLDTNGIPISAIEKNQLNPSAAFNGYNFLVVWEDYRNGFSDIYGTEVTSSGVVLDPGGILISDGTYPDRFPDLVRIGNGRSLVVYLSFRSIPDGSDRIYGRLFESSVGIQEEEAFRISQVSLFQNRPNPFHRGTTLSFNLPTSSFTSLKVYDITGRLVNVVLEGKKKAGFYTIGWDGRNEEGRNLSSGVYFFQLTTGNSLNTFTKKMILIH